MSTIDNIIIGIFLLALIGIGLYARTNIKNMDDFMLGGRRFKRIALTGTIMATMVGSGMTMGTIGKAFSNGANVIWGYIGFAIGLLLFSVLAKKIRSTNKRTMAEIIALKFGKRPRLVAAAIIFLYAITNVAIDIAGMGRIIAFVFGDSLGISLTTAAAIGAAIGILYTSIGGMYAVVWTDTVQLIIMIIGIFIIGPIIGLNLSGGFDVIATTYASDGLSIMNPFVGGTIFSVGLALSYFLATPADPTMPQRALSAKDGKVARDSFLVSGVLALIMGFVLLIIGGSARVLMPNLVETYGTNEAALPVFILNYYPPVLRGITLAGILAAIMSSIDSFLILASTHFMYDIGKTIKKDLSEDRIKKLLPIATVAIGCIALINALFISSIFDYLYMMFSIIGAALVPSFIAALYFEDKVTEMGTSSSMIIGALVPAVLYLTVGYDVFLGDPVFIGLISSVATLVLVSIFTKKKTLA